MTLTAAQRGNDTNGNTTNASGYRYFNALPGTVAPASSAVGQATETTTQVLNPATLWTQADPGDANPEVAGPRGAEDPAGDNPAATGNAGDNEGVPMGDHSAQLPLAPTTVTAVAGAAGHAVVSWHAPSDPDGYAITGYTVTATTSDGGTSPVSATVGNVLTANLAGLSSTKHYTFKVAAINIAGTGAQSAASASLLIG